jgi:hypothetical protein
MTDRKKPGVGFWATVVVVVVLLYPISFGPACWSADRKLISERSVAKGYSFFLSTAFDGENVAAPLLNWWADLGARRDGAAKRIVCRHAATEIGCGTISGCGEDDIGP